MGVTDFNLQGLRTRTFKGFMQFQSPDPNSTEYFRLKERQSVRIDFRFDYQTHFSDSGQKALDPQGYGHTFTIDLKTTSDLFDDTWLDEDAVNDATQDNATGDFGWNTLSYWIARANGNNPIEVTFVATLSALSGPGTTAQIAATPSAYDSGDPAQKWIHIKFVLQPSVFGPITYGTGGSNNITVSGDVLSIDYIKRTNSSVPT